MRLALKEIIGVGGISNYPVYSAEENLQRLSRTSILEDFVRENDNKWDHRKWIELSEKIEKRGLYPIDFAKVRVLLNGIKGRYPNI